MYRCRVCEHNNDKERTEVVELTNVREDLNSSFKYFKCSKCGCIQIIEIPDDIGKYYSNENYYSFGSKNRENGKRNILKNTLKSLLLGTKLYRFLKRDWLKSTDIKLQAIREIDEKDKTQRILDIGCGSGDFLNRLRGLGYKNLLGIDPYLEGDFETDNGVKIKPVAIDQIDGIWDQIWMIHSFEHIENPKEVLEAIKNRLDPDGGVFVMELPLCDSYEYDRYGKYWTGCDAPVHIVMYTIRGLEIMLKEVGLKIVNRYNMATENFLILSEMAECGYHLKQSDDVTIQSVLGQEKIKELRETMSRINQEKKSGLVTLIIKAV